MKLLTALTVAAGLSLAAVPASYAAMAAGSPATLNQIEMAQTAQLISVDQADFTAPNGQDLNGQLQALSANPTINSMLSSNDVDVQSVVAVTYGDDGGLMIYYSPEDNAAS